MSGSGARIGMTLTITRYHKRKIHETLRKISIECDGAVVIAATWRTCVRRAGVEFHHSTESTIWDFVSPELCNAMQYCHITICILSTYILQGRHGSVRLERVERFVEIL